MGVRLVKYGVGNSTGTYNHNELINRDLPDQHPISAITGLEDRLNNITGIENIVNTKSLTLEYDQSTKTLTGNVNVFNSEDNAIKEKATGLFVDKYFEVETEDTSSVHLYMEGLGETLKTMYENGNVFSHNGGTNNIASTSEANAWYFDDALESFVQPENTTTFTGFVSTVKYRTYTHRATLRSTDSDNDANGLVIAYVLDENGYPHTLSCIVNKGEETHIGNFNYALVYNKSLSGEQIIAIGTMSEGHTTDGWSSNYITMEVTKAGNAIECSISNWDSLDINLDTTINIDLYDYEWGHYFTGRVQYGYCNQSQADSYFTDIYFNGKGPLKAEVILSEQDDNMLEILDDGLYVDITKAFPNKGTLDKLSESTDGKLLYNGNEIGGGNGTVTISPDSSNAIKVRENGLFVQDLSSHVLETIYSESGTHGLRYYNNKLQYYYDSRWNDISMNTTVDKDIVISPTQNNALTKYSNGYYVQAFLISKQSNNALIKYSDGYYVPKIPANNATTDDIDALKDEIDDELAKQNKTLNERYDIITTKLLEISGNTTKTEIHEYSGSNFTLDSVIDISELYNLSSDVILSLEFMIKNNSSVDVLTIKILENDIETLNDTLTESEVQRYKLPNIPNIEIFIKGDYQLFLYVNYI